MTILEELRALRSSFNEHAADPGPAPDLPGVYRE
jgi:hypothetical protein